MINNPLVSIIVPCYKQSQYLDECLGSVFDQTYPTWECIIVNDGSPDNTDEIAEKWVNKDKRFKYIYKENGGLSSARNAGLEAAEGEWVQFLDCDDKLSNDKLAVSSKYFNNYELIVTDFICFNDLGVVDSYCNYVNEEIDFESIVLKWDLDFSIPIHAGLFIKKYIKQFDDDLGAKEDWLFWINYLSLTSKTIVVNTKGALYRMHSNSMTKNRELMYANEINVYQKVYDFLEPGLRKRFFVSRMIYKNNIILSTLKELDRINNSKGQIFLSYLRNLKLRLKL